MEYNLIHQNDATFLEIGQLMVSEILLRHHCQCSECVDPISHQRLFHFDASNIENVKLIGCNKNQDNSGVNIDWKDGHKSFFALSYLQSLCLKNSPNHILWNNTIVSNDFDSPLKMMIPQHDYLFDNGDALRKLLKQIETFGFGIVSGVTPTPESTEKIIERMAPIMETIYGKLWTFTSKMTDRRDLAYTCDALKHHTDLTYYYAPAGLQIFHLIQNDGVTGGETILMDGFYAANQLKMQYPHYYKILCKYKVIHEYKKSEENISINSLDSVLKVRKNGDGEDLFHVRFNRYDLVALSANQNNIDDFYKAYAQFTSIIDDVENCIELALQPGLVIFIDNWRILHGRKAFSGPRIMCGAYVERELWKSAASIHNNRCDET